MSGGEDPHTTLALVLNELHELSFVAHRDFTAALPAIEPFGPDITARWAQTGRDLFLHDRDAGKAFLRASPELARTVGAVGVWTEQARGFLSYRGSWKGLTAYLAVFGEAVSEFGLEGARAWADMGIRFGRAHQESGEVFFQTPVTELSAGRGLEGAHEILLPLSELASGRALPPGLALPGAIKVRARLGHQALLPWLKRGTDILKSGRMRGEAFFRLEGPDSDEALLADLPGFKTGEQERFLTLFTHAALGVTPRFGSGDLKFDGPAFVETDGRTLFVPPAFPARAHALAAILHHMGHLRFGTYDADALARLFREVGMEHPPLDAKLRMTWRPLFAVFGEDMCRFQVLFDLCEDFRIDARVQRVMPNHVPRMLEQATDRPAGPAGVYYEIARQSLRGLMGEAPCEEPFLSLRAPDADLVTSWRCAREWHDRADLPALTLEERAQTYLPGRSPNHQRAVYPRTPHAGKGPEEEDDDGGGAAAPRHSERKPAQETAAGDPDMALPPEDTSGSGGRVGVGRPQPAVTTTRRRRLRPVGEGLPYPEWDYREKAYRRDWTRVVERSLIERDADVARSLLARYAGTLRRLRRAIAAEKPRRLTPKRRQSEGDELDLDAAVQYVVDRRTGTSPAPTIYRQRRPAARDTAVLLLADLSTSIMQQTASGQERVVDRMKAGLLMFALSLKELGDSYAIAGFASKYRDAVSYYPIKGFFDPFTADMEAVLGGLSGRLATRMGAAIRHACVQFGQVDAGVKLLLVMSDGRPADYDDGGDERYLHEDTRMAIKEAADRGIHAFCVTLDKGGASYLERIFGRGHFLVVDSLEELPARLPQIYFRLRKSGS